MRIRLLTADCKLRTQHAVSLALLAALTLLPPAGAHAQAPKRLSSWILEQPASPNNYPLGLSWRVPAEVPAQNALRLDLLKSLSGLDREIPVDSDAVARLRDWVTRLPVTGRVLVAAADGWWLQANPARDPVLLPGHTVVLPQRPSTVTVITEKGTRCLVPHIAGHEVRAYLKACNPASAAKTDFAWIAQPDGREARFGIALWNLEPQDEPAPGAWIWAPPRDSGWTKQFSQKLIEFMATQGPAPDAGLETPPIKEKDDIKLGAHNGKTRPLAGGGMSNGLSFSARPDRQRRDQDLSAPVETLPSEPAAKARALQITASDWGNAGLLQMPSARMRDVGTLSFTASHTSPYTRGNVFLQPFEWMEAGLRYTDISNRAYGPPELSGNQSFKDKGFDIKLRLWPESAYIPEIAVGGRDIAGTGLFSGEYLVASKRAGAFDWTVGLAWGYLAGQQRGGFSGQGGEFNVTNYFSGAAKPFAGMQLHTPIDRLILKLEYEANDYQREPIDNRQKQTTRWNVGAVYRVARAWDLGVAFERGNRLSLSLTLHTQLDGLSTPKLSDPPRVPFSPTRPEPTPNWAVTSRDIARQSNWRVRRIEQQENVLRVTLDDADAIYWRARIDRIAAVLHRDAPQSIDRFTLAYRERGLEMAEHVIDREAWVARQAQPLPPSEQREIVMARRPEPATAANVVYEDKRERFEHGLGLNYIQTLGGPDGFVLYQISAIERAKLWIRDDTWIQGALRLRLVDNYDKFRYTGPSNLPRVRTFQREYFTTSRVTMPNLQVAHIGRLSENQYYSVYAGYLEEMFGGAGAEWLYRPFASRIAVGVDINEVKQRDFHQDFRFRDYRATTGHATMYWDTGWQDVQATVSAGRYLAGDIGATINLSRTFKNGVTVGAFATRTNASAVEFGEGSFDKGVYVRIPFDAIFTRTTNTVGTFLYRPLTRDGGAKLGRAVSLYDITRLRDDRTLRIEPAPLPNEKLTPADHPPQSLHKAPELKPYTSVVPRPLEVDLTSNKFQENLLTEALYAQEFRNIQIDYNTSKQLVISASNDRLTPISLAVGRAARTALRLAPLDARELKIAYVERARPIVTYSFFDLRRLERYFSGAISQAEIAEYVAIEYTERTPREKNPLARLNDLEPVGERINLAATLPEIRSFGRVADDVLDAARTTTQVNWLYAAPLGAGIVLASSTLDRRADRFVRDHTDSRWLKGGNRLGNAIPWIGLAGAGLAALDSSDPIRSRTGFAAGEAVVTAAFAATGLKYAIGRARPKAELGNRSFDFLSRENSAFPSLHSAVAWAVATPFALEYDAPWLYGVAALANAARIGSREHWVSDTVGGSLLGYGLGRIFWESARNPRKDIPRVLLAPRGIALAWELE